MIFAIGLIVIGVIGLLGVIIGFLNPIVQNEWVTNLIGKTAATVICVIGAIACILGGVLKLAGVF